MHQVGGRHDLATEGLADALVSQADPQQGDVPGQRSDGLEAHPAVLGTPRAGRDEHGVGLLGPDARHVDGVVAVHHRLGPQLAQFLDQVVDERVVVVEEEHPRSHGPTIVPPPGPDSRPERPAGAG